MITTTKNDNDVSIYRIDILIKWSGTLRNRNKKRTLLRYKWPDTTLKSFDLFSNRSIISEFLCKVFPYSFTFIYCVLCLLINKEISNIRKRNGRGFNGFAATKIGINIACMDFCWMDLWKVCPGPRYSWNIKLSISFF